MNENNKFTRIVVTSQTNIMGGPNFGTLYDLSKSCPVCGTGAIPTGARFLKIKKIPKQSVFQTLDGEIIFSDNIADVLRSVGTTFLSEVRDATSRKLLPFYELRAEAEMPHFSGNTTGYEKERPCQTCQRDGYFEIPDVPLHMVFPPATGNIQNAKVLATHERFGNSKLRTPFNDSVFARPLFLVSKQLFDAINTLRLPGVTFEDVYFK